MKDEIISNLRWKNYFISNGDSFNKFWKNFLNSNDKDILFILGLGFDPRMCSCAEKIMNLNGKGERDCYLLRFDEGEDSPSHRYRDEIEQNYNKIQKIFEKKGSFITKDIKMFSDDGRRIGSRSAPNLFSNSGQELKKYSDIIIDISSIPRILYFPVIGKLLHIYDNLKTEEKKFNLHIVVAENPELDMNIEMEGIDERANYIHGFGGGIDKESNASIPGIWMPILGEKRGIHLDRINALVNPEEICPILPFPSQNPRRGDNLILEYRELLFDKLGVEPENIIFVSEQNPFDTYRKIIRTAIQYNKTLNPIGGCKIILSALSSKLLSLGTIMAAYDLTNSNIKDKPIATGIAHIEAKGYNILKKQIESNEELFSIWIAGECYEK